MKIHVNIEHELLCERFEREWPYNYPLILVAYMSPAEIAESAERISVQVSAISALSAGLIIIHSQLHGNSCEHRTRIAV